MIHIQNVQPPTPAGGSRVRGLAQGAPDAGLGADGGLARRVAGGLGDDGAGADGARRGALVGVDAGDDGRGGSAEAVADDRGHFSTSVLWFWVTCVRLVRAPR